MRKITPDSPFVGASTNFAANDDHHSTSSPISDLTINSTPFTEYDEEETIKSLKSVMATVFPNQIAKGRQMSATKRNLVIKVRDHMLANSLRSLFI